MSNYIPVFYVDVITCPCPIFRVDLAISVVKVATGGKLSAV